MEAEKKLNNLFGEVKLISTNELTKDLVNRNSVLEDTKYFTESGSQDYSTF